MHDLLADRARRGETHATRLRRSRRSRALRVQTAFEVRYAGEPWGIAGGVVPVRALVRERAIAPASLIRWSRT
ncbi:hypothetical protein [Phyllobacterium sp. K27]